MNLLHIPEQILPFTLFHSLWLGLLIYLLTRVALVFVSQKNSQLRYGIVTGALALFFVSVCTTLLVLLPEKSEPVSMNFIPTFIITAANTELSGSWLNILQQMISTNSHPIILAWLSGAALFIARLSGSWWYVQRLSRNSIPLVNEWAIRLTRLSEKINLKKRIQLMESALVDAPIVAGIIRPVIILPIGLTSGLSAEQVEAIFIHELVHIKRHDYLVNLFQSILEAFFFFNPFVWLLSSLIRKEREHCCDDAVVSFGGNAKAYVLALASLEEGRLNRNGLALSLAGNKNHLLKRIKRLMEKSVRTYSLRDKIIPVVLLVIGFACASWLSIQRNIRPESNGSDNALSGIIQEDTTIRIKKSEVKKSRKSKDRDKRDDSDSDDYNFIDEELIEREVEQAMAEMPPIPPIEIDFPEMPEFPDFPDSIPPGMHYDWQAFAEEFNKKFKEEFSDFYSKHEPELQRMMEELQAKHEAQAGQMMALAHAEAARAEAWSRKHEVELRNQEVFHKKHEAAMAEHEKKMKEWESKHAEKMKVLEAKMKVHEANMKAWEKAVRAELERDGYLEKGEEIKNMYINDEGEMKVNGKEIKESHRRKYMDLQKKYFKKDE